LLVADDFTGTARTAAVVQRLDPNAPILIPARSIVRVIWTNA
jgi:hypothetical protein